MRQTLVLAVALTVLAARIIRAQSNLTPLVTPPASVGECSPASPPRNARPDLAQAIAHRLLIHGTRPGEQREITLFVRNGHPLLLNDVALVMTSPTSTSLNSIAARFDSTGAVGGVRIDGTSKLPDSVLTMRQDREALRRIAREQSKNTTSRAALKPAEQARAGEMAAWLLKRCP